jgi:hypothetical protein
LAPYVLNAGFYKPALLARHAADVDLLSDGRLELGLGAGYVQKESRSRAPEPHRLSGARHHLCPSAPPPRAGPDRGNGDHILTPAAQQADIIGLTGSNLGEDDDGDPLGERVAFVRGAAGDRFAGLELNLAVTASPTDNSARGDGEPSQA